MVSFRVVLLVVQSAAALDNGIALTPPMGWSTWNKLQCHFNAAKLLDIADHLQSSGMVAAGYETLNIDDCWPLKSRDANGSIVPDPNKFPYGMKNFSLELNKRGLTLGIYTGHGNYTCMRYPASYGHEEQDAQAYADWGVTFVKNDWCSNRPHYPAVPDLEAFNAMRDAINRTGHRMTYSVHWNYGNTACPGCDKGQSCPLPDTAHMWRVGGDIKAQWAHVLQLIDISTPLAPNAGPGRWNDMDMLEVGNGMSEEEDRAHFTMWAMLASPLVAGNDVAKMSNATRAILTNPHVLAVNQDPLGRQAVLLANGSLPGSRNLSFNFKNLWDWQVFGRPLALPEGSYAVALLNRNDTMSINITANFSALGTNASFRVLDLWDDGQDLGVHNSITATLPLKSAKMYKLVPTTFSADAIVV